MSKIRILVNGGIGDCLQGFSCADLLQKQGDTEDNISVGVFARPEIFQPLNELFKDKFSITQLPDSFLTDYQLEKNPELWFNFSKGYDETYLVIPDLLFRNPHSFNYKKYNLTLNQIKTNRLLENKRKSEKLVYLGLLSTTPGYTYYNVPDLVVFLCKQNPNYKFYLPNNITWDGKKVFFHIKVIPTNLVIDDNPTFMQSFEWLCKSDLAIVGDNGISHLAYHLGIDRILLDPQYNKSMFLVRWREDYNDSIPITTSSIDVAKLTKVLLDVPQTRLLPKKLIIDRLVTGEINWSQELNFKF